MKPFSNRNSLAALATSLAFFISVTNSCYAATTYTVVDTGQSTCYNGNGAEMSCPSSSEKAFNGQDSQYNGNQPHYTDNGDGTITDQITGLVWQQDYRQINWYDAPSDAASMTTGGFSDWRVPTIKELYSLINFAGNQGSGDPSSSTPPSDASPFIDINYFDFEYPVGTRYIDAQYVTNTEYTSRVSLDGTTHQEVFFGVNFADGRIKGYPKSGSGPNSQFYARYVRGNTSYGKNKFNDNGNGTISDAATNLTWMQVDSGASSVAGNLAGYTYSNGALNWGEALDFCETLTYGGSSDWKLPNAKELHTIVDYTRSPDYTYSPAIDPIFETTSITNEGGDLDFPGFWTSTSFKPGRDGIVIYFGEALGKLYGQYLDVHGAGAQRTDLKQGTPTAGFGPQGDVRRVYNYARCVRDDGSVSSQAIAPILLLLLNSPR